jgi:hypothetical protein
MIIIKSNLLDQDLLLMISEEILLIEIQHPCLFNNLEFRISESERFAKSNRDDVPGI